MKNVLAVTGTRADYGIYKPVFEALRKSEKIGLGLLVTGMHLSEAFGHTVDEIREDGFVITAELNTLSDTDTPAGTKAFAQATTLGCVDVFSREKPDIVLVLGDRTEMLAAAQAAHTLGIPIAHLHGGESSGSLDDAQRHKITQMASLHLTSAKQHAAAIRKMKPQESPEHIFVVGAPALDAIKSMTLLPKKKLFMHTDFEERWKTLLFIQHPDTLDPLPIEDQMKPSLDALSSFDGNILIIGANADAGGRRMNIMLQHFAEGKDHCTFLITLPHREFLLWEASVDVLVGNSSSGIIEAASFHRPVVNIGDRQKNRTQSGNVIDVPYKSAVITEAIDRALYDPAFQKSVQQCTNIYGDGNAAENIVRILEDITL